MQKWRTVYSSLISTIGVLLILWGVAQFVTSPPPLTLYLLLALGVMAQVTMTGFAEINAGVSVSSAVSLTTAYLYGPVEAAMVAATAEIGLSIMRLVGNRGAEIDWKRQTEVLGVNIGMNTIAAFAAGVVLRQLSAQLGDLTILGQLAPWLAAAIVGDQINLWLLVFIIHLSSGAKPLDVWRENRWAIPINVLVMSVGGGLLALAVQQFDLLGIAIFFLPILLSAYSFRLTVNNAKQQMVKLEEMVTLRTQALADANKKLENLHKEKDAFLAVLTHDMRTPLTSIKGYASILRDRELAREQQQKIAKVILHSQDTLLEIVNNILEIEKLQSGVPVLLESTNFDLALLTKTAVETLAAPAMEKNITLQYEEVPSPVMVTADMSKIQRVLLNLVSNAIKYTGEGGTISVETAVNGRYACVTVQDNGYGIPADELPHIFNRYSRVKGHQHIAIGTGLGLAIVKSLVEAHDGEIVVASEENVGSIFTMKLPL